MKKITITILTVLMFMTPIFSIPKLPMIPNITVSVTLPEEYKKVTEQVGKESIKNLNIDWSKLNFKFNLNK